MVWYGALARPVHLPIGLQYAWALRIDRFQLAALGEGT